MKEQTVRQKRFLSTNLAGTTFNGRQETLKELSKKRAFYKLVRDKDNEYDKYAVKVVAIDSNKKEHDVGFLPRNKNLEIAYALDQEENCYIRSYRFIGGYNNKNYGLVVNINYNIRANQRREKWMN